MGPRYSLKLSFGQKNYKIVKHFDTQHNYTKNNNALHCDTQHMTHFIMILSIMTSILMTLHYDIQHDETQCNDTMYFDTQHNNTLH